jgi:hypothetical protein
MDHEFALVDNIANGQITSLDGVMSPTSQAIKERLGVDRFHMVSWWVMTAQDWTCLGCGRNKVDIARTNNQGEAMCHLHEHHDHMKEVLERRFNEFAVARAEVVADEVCKSFASRSAAMIIAYESTVVCADCNNADTVAKRLVGTPDDFSFSPQEIRQFVISAPNRTHEVDETTARMIWESQKPTFELRMRIASRIAEIAASNEHWYQAAPYNTSARSIENHSAYLVEQYGANNQVIPILCGSRQNVQKKGAAEWRLKKNLPCKTPPSQNDIELIKNVSAPRAWTCISDTWSCEICRRPKIQTIKRNSKKDWGFHAQNSALYSDKGEVRRTICEDCRYVAMMIGKEFSVRSGEDGTRFLRWLKPEELESLIVPQAHARHNINNKYVDDLMNVLAERLGFV